MVDAQMHSLVSARGRSKGAPCWARNNRTLDVYVIPVRMVLHVTRDNINLSSPDSNFSPSYNFILIFSAAHLLIEQSMLYFQTNERDAAQRRRDFRTPAIRTQQ